MPPDNKEEVLRLRITADLKKAVEDIADQTGESMSVIVRQALRAFISEHRAAAEAGLESDPKYQAWLRQQQKDGEDITDHIADSQGKKPGPGRYPRSEANGTNRLNEPRPDDDSPEEEAP